MTRSLVNKDSVFPTTLRDDFLTPLEHAFDQFFSDFFSGTSALDKVKATGGYPKMDIVVEDDHLVIKAALPGVPVENVLIEMVRGRQDESSDHLARASPHTLRISGKMSEEHSSRDAQYYVRELSKRSFTRQVVLPDWVQSDPEASMRDGILQLKWKLPAKPFEKDMTRVIPIKKD